MDNVILEGPQSPKIMNMMFSGSVSIHISEDHAIP